MIKKLWKYLNRNSTNGEFDLPAEYSITYEDLPLAEYKFHFEDISKHLYFLSTIDEDELFLRNCKEYLISKELYVNTVRYWHSKDGMMIANLDETHKLWVKECERVIGIYNKLNRVRKTNPTYSFNIRILEPYIIEIREIVGMINTKMISK